MWTIECGSAATWLIVEFAAGPPGEPPIIGRQELSKRVAAARPASVVELRHVVGRFAADS